MTESPVVTGSLLFALADRLRARLVSGVSGQPDEGFGLQLPDGTPVGSVHVWRSPTIRLAVEVRLADPVRGLAASMLHAFAPRNCLTPHLVCDMALTGHRLVIGADLVPRIDAAAAPDWAEFVWGPLEAQRDLYLATPGVTGTADVSARLRSLCSPWLITTAQGFENSTAAEQMLDALVDRFAALCATGLESPDGSLAERDHRYLSALLSEETDPVWQAVADLIGSPTRDRLVSLMVDG